MANEPSPRCDRLVTYWRRSKAYVSEPKRVAAAIALLATPSMFAFRYQAFHTIFKHGPFDLQEPTVDSLALKTSIPVALFLGAPADGEMMRVHWLSLLNRFKTKESASLLPSPVAADHDHHHEHGKCLVGFDRFLTLAATGIYGGVVYAGMYELFDSHGPAIPITIFGTVGIFSIFQGHSLTGEHHHRESVATGGEVQSKRDLVGFETKLVIIMTAFAGLAHSLHALFEIYESEGNIPGFEETLEDVAWFIGILIANSIPSIIMGIKDALVEKHHIEEALEDRPESFWNANLRTWLGRLAAFLTSFSHALPVFAVFAKLMGPHVNVLTYIIVSAIVSAPDALANAAVDGPYIRDFYGRLFDGVRGVLVDCCKKASCCNDDDIEKVSGGRLGAVSGGP